MWVEFPQPTTSPAPSGTWPNLFPYPRDTHIIPADLFGSLQLLPSAGWGHLCSRTHRSSLLAADVTSAWRKKQSGLSLILIKHFLLSQWNWKTHVGVSSHSMKDKTMLYKNGVNVKPFGTSCPAHFPLNSSWEDVLKMFPSCVCHTVLQMMRRNEDSCRLFQTERIHKKMVCFP